MICQSRKGILQVQGCCMQECQWYLQIVVCISQSQEAQSIWRLHWYWPVLSSIFCTPTLAFGSACAAHIQQCLRCTHSVVPALHTFNSACAAHIQQCLRCTHSVVPALHTFNSACAEHIQQCLRCTHSVVPALHTFSTACTAHIHHIIFPLHITSRNNFPIFSCQCTDLANVNYIPLTGKMAATGRLSYHLVSAPPYHPVTRTFALFIYSNFHKY